MKHNVKNTLTKLAMVAGLTGMASLEWYFLTKEPTIIQNPTSEH